jgi:hypothetical protein
MRQLKRRSRIPGHIEQKIIQLALVQDFTPGQIYRELGGKEAQVSYRTVLNVVKAVTPQDPSAPWGLGDAEDEAEARAVLGAMADVLWQFPKAKPVTLNEASWISRIAGVAPGLSPCMQWIVARQYLVAKGRNESTLGLDLFLALQPWESKEAHKVYDEVTVRLGEARHYTVAVLMEQLLAWAEGTEAGKSLRAAAGLN